MQSSAAINPNPDPAPARSPHEPDDTRELLRQVHHAVTSSPRSGRLQVLTAVVLSLATLTSTWCGYQAARWSGVQDKHQSASDTAERQAAESTLAGLQLRTQDGLVVLEYWRALRAGDQGTSATVLAHMRPELQRAVEASIREGILTKPSVRGPLQQEEYTLAVETLAGVRREEARKESERALAAGQTSSEYVLLTLTLASVLFVGGVSNTFSRTGVRRALGLIALLVFAVSIARLSLLSVQWPALAKAPRPAVAE